MIDGENKNERKALSEIESGKVKMRPKWYFLGQTALLVVGTMLLAFVMLFLASFVVFMMRQTGIWFIPAFGISKFGLLLRSLPWILIILVIIFAVILEFLVKQYSFGYRRPLLYSALGIIIIAIAGGIFLEMTPLHRMLYASARNNHLPFGGGIYQHYGGGMMGRNIIAGNITSVSPAGFAILTPRDEEIFLNIDSNTEISTLSEFKEGDAIVAFIKMEGETVTALEIRKISDEMHFPKNRRMRGPGPGMMHQPMMRFQLDGPVL